MNDVWSHIDYIIDNTPWSTATTLFDVATLEAEKFTLLLDLSVLLFRYTR